MTISGIGTGARSCPSARRIGNDFIGNRVLGVSLVFFGILKFGFCIRLVKSRQWIRCLLEIFEDEKRLGGTYLHI